MAVYKATYCYPFLNTVDARVTVSEAFKTTAQYLKCKVDSSNINVTGYKIRILDGDNNVIFPLDEGNISPIAELASLINANDGTNTGVNGTFLQIPFFQNFAAPMLKDEISGDHDFIKSYNAIYYLGNLSVTYCMDKTESQHDEWEWSDDENGWIIGPVEGHENADGHFIDGEIVSAGQLVLVMNSDDHDGIFRAVLKKEEGTTDKLYILLEPYNDEVIHLFKDVGNNQREGVVNVLQGKDKINQNFKLIINSQTFDTLSIEEFKDHMWVDWNNNPITGFNLNGSTYKWEITLYQGYDEEDLYSHISRTEISSTEGYTPYEINYDDLPDKWFDMKLTSGTILGSTPDRIQIADILTELGEEVPTGTVNGPVILQSRYLRLSNTYNGDQLFGENSTYVQSYDATYGHVYPIDNQLETSAIDNANYVQFFKHSSNAEDILNTDIVDYSISENIDFIWAKQETSGTTTTWRTYSTEAEWQANTSSTNRIIEISEAVYTRAGGEDQRLLLRGQKDPKQNGVWKLYSITIKTSQTESTTHYCIKRAASYTDWASFIGKVIYVVNGDDQGTNIESLANAGTFTLWNPHTSAGAQGDSPLLLTHEIPILLYGNKIYKTAELYYDQNLGAETSITLTSDRIDDMTYEIGDIILFKDYIATIQSIAENTQGYSVTFIDKEAVDNTKYYYITSGQEKGHKVFKGSETTPNYDLYTARVLKNNNVYTYISPYNGLMAHMKLKMANNKVIKYHDDDNTESVWLDIQEVNSVLWRIKSTEHDTLLSYDNAAKDIPYKYEVRSYFKVSDQNVFYSYSSPYVIIEINHKPFGNFTEEIGYSPFMVDNDDGDPLQMMVKIDGTIDRFVPLYVRSYETISKLVGRSLNISGKYIQSQGVSWENYRWVLLDSTGKVLQDTGKQYNKEIDVNFYGLANDTTQSNLYYAVLYIEDSLNNVIQYTIKLEIVSSNSKEGTNALLVPFTAEYDCTTHSTILKYEDNGIMKPSYNVDQGGMLPSAEQAFMEKNSEVTSIGWDDSITYENECVNIVGVDEQLSVSSIDAPIYINKIDKENATQCFNYSGKDSENISVAYKPSTPVLRGLAYNTYFGRSYYEVNGEGKVTGNKDQIITLGDDVLNWEYDSSAPVPMKNNQLYTLAEVQLDSNYCGEFFGIDVEGDINGSNSNPVVDASGDAVDLTGYLTFSLYLPDDLVINQQQASASVDLHKIGFRLYKNRNSANPYTITHYFTVDVDDEAIELEFSTAAGKKYYLQDKNAVLDTYAATKANASDFMHYNLNNKLWFKYLEGDKYSTDRYMTSSSKFLGNICTVSTGEEYTYTTAPSGNPVLFPKNNYARLNNGPIYWSENRRHLQTVDQIELDNEEMFVQTENFGIHCIDDSAEENNTIKWPGESDRPENEAYWLENDLEAEKEKLPVNWEDVNINLDKNGTPDPEAHSSLTYFRGVERHLGAFENQFLKIQYKVHDIYTLYNSIVLSEAGEWIKNFDILDDVEELEDGKEICAEFSITLGNNTASSIYLAATKVTPEQKKAKDMPIRSRRAAIRFSGVGKYESIGTQLSNTVVDENHDGRMRIDYCYVLNTTHDLIVGPSGKFTTIYTDHQGRVPYNEIYGLEPFTLKLPNPENPDDKKDVSCFWKDFCPVILNFSEDPSVVVSDEEGMYAKDTIRANNYSVYKREYEVFGIDAPEKYTESKGNWTPVIINSPKGEFRDFNIRADRTYQYILYPSDYLNNGAEINGQALQIFANYDRTIYSDEDKEFKTGGKDNAWNNGEPVVSNWQDWSIIELIPQENEKNVPIVKKTYKANLEQMWFFKYALETGAQTQNITRNEVQTLGQYPKIGYGQSNYVSGDVTAMLGSEIRPYRGDSYVERVWMNNRKDQTIKTTNERELMLSQWRAFVSSKNPKLLRDMKGQSWIVQIMSGSNTPRNFVKNQPDTISFQWKQIDSTDNCIIWGDTEVIPTRNSTDELSKIYEKTPMFKTGKFAK